MDKEITEGKARIDIPVTEKISKAMPAFYNPVMKLNRDISVLVLKAWDKSQLNIALPLAGTGVRAIRFLKELPKSKIKRVYVNDISTTAVGYIRKNLGKNNQNLLSLQYKLCIRLLYLKVGDNTILVCLFQ